MKENRRLSNFMSGNESNLNKKPLPKIEKKFINPCKSSDEQTFKFKKES